MQSDRGASERSSQRPWCRGGSGKGKRHQKNQQLWGRDDAGPGVGWGGEDCRKTSQRGRNKKMDSMKNYYAVLGLTPGTSSREIKRAYQKLVRKCHPDFHPDDPACRTKIQKINEAYEILSVPVKRRAYDQQREKGELVSPGEKGFCDAQGDHPFFSYFLRMNAMSRKRDQVAGNQSLRAAVRGD